MINSKSNETYKKLLKLKKDKQYLFLDNPKLIEEAINAGFKIEYIIKNESGNKGYEKFEIIELSNALFKSFQTTINSQGLIAVIKNTKKQAKAPLQNFLVLDGLQDPGNVGTIIRSAAGFNFKDIYLVDCVNVLNEKLVRSSMGAIFKTNVYEMTHEEFLGFYNDKLKNKTLLCADMDGENIFKTKNLKNVGVVLGNEGNGVCEDIKALCNKTISIPMQNNLESLNVAVAGAIIMSFIANV